MHGGSVFQVLKHKYKPRTAPAPAPGAPCPAGATRPTRPLACVSIVAWMLTGTSPRYCSSKPGGPASSGNPAAFRKGKRRQWQPSLGCIRSRMTIVLLCTNDGVWGMQPGPGGATPHSLRPLDAASANTAESIASLQALGRGEAMLVDGSRFLAAATGLPPAALVEVGETLGCSHSQLCTSGSPGSALTGSILTRSCA